VPWIDGTSSNRTISEIEALDEAVFSRAGSLIVATGAGRFYVPRAREIIGVVAAVGTAPTGSTILVDVNKNGTTIFTTQGARPSIAIGATKVASAAVPAVTTVVAGDLLSVDIDQVGSTIPGADLTVIVLMAA
jgi:hypothetical protein